MQWKRLILAALVGFAVPLLLIQIGFSVAQNIDEVARTRIDATDRRILVAEESIKEIIEGQRAIQSRMDMGLGGLVILGALSAGQFFIAWRGRR